MPNLISFLALGPLGGKVDREATTVHAITAQAGMEGHPGPYRAPCGEMVLPVVFRYKDGADRVLLWPIRAKGELTRCRECWVATGQKRPRRRP